MAVLAHDADSKREHRGNSEAWRPAELTKSEPNILEQISHRRLHAGNATEWERQVALQTIANGKPLILKEIAAKPNMFDVASCPELNLLVRNRTTA